MVSQVLAQIVHHCLQTALKDAQMADNATQSQLDNYLIEGKYVKHIDAKLLATCEIVELHRILLGVQNFYFTLACPLTEKTEVQVRHFRVLCNAAYDALIHTERLEGPRPKLAPGTDITHIRALHDEKQRVVSQLQVVEAQLLVLNKDNAKCLEELTAASAQLRAAQEKAEALGVLLDERNVKIAKMNAQADVDVRRIAELEAATQTIVKEREELRLLNASLETQNGNLLMQVDRLKQDKEEEVGNFRALFKDYEQKIRDLEHIRTTLCEEKEKLRKLFQELTEKHSSLDNSYDELENEFNIVCKEKERLEGQVSELLSVQQRLEEERDDNCLLVEKVRKEYKAEKERLTQQLKEALEAKEKAQSERDDYAARLSRLRVSFEMLQQ